MDCVRLAILRIIRKPSRSIMLMIGIAVGVLSITVINGISDCGREVIATQLDTMGLYGMSITFEENSSLFFSDNDITEIRKNIDGIKAITPVAVDYKPVSVQGQKADCVIWGINEHADTAMNLDITHGDMISTTDCRNGATVCLITEDFANKNFLSAKSSLGKTVSIYYQNEKVDFTVKGVIKAGSEGLSTALSEYIPAFIYVPNVTHTSYNGKNCAQRIAITTEENYNEQRVAEKIVRYLNVLYNGQGGFTIENLNDTKESFDGILSIITDVLSAIGGVSLVVSGISIMTVMMITVKERTREIGIKKSIGARDEHILTEFLIEAALISVAGSFMGIIFAGIVFCLAESIMSIEISIPISDYFITCLLAVCIGVVFSVIPALSAARLDPVKAFKTD